MWSRQDWIRWTKKGRHSEAIDLPGSQRGQFPIYLSSPSHLSVSSPISQPACVFVWPLIHSHTPALYSPTPLYYLSLNIGNVTSKFPHFFKNFVTYPIFLSVHPRMSIMQSDPRTVYKLLISSKDDHLWRGTYGELLKINLKTFH